MNTNQDLKAEVSKRYLPKTFCQDEEESFPKVKGELRSIGELMKTTMERQVVWALGWLFPKESGIKGPTKRHDIPQQLLMQGAWTQHYS